MSQLENTILSQLLTNDEYMRRVIPFIQPKYFSEENRSVFRLYGKHVQKYKKLPSKKALQVAAEEASNLTETAQEVSERLDLLYQKEEHDLDWLICETEKWCQDRAVFHAIMESIDIIDGKTKEVKKDAIPDILTKALSVSFDRSVGHDYLEDIERRYEFYTKVENKLPFDLEYLNKITSGGVNNKTLNILMAGTGVGKSLALCHFAASYLSQNKNVLYVTLEMAEERIAERIDANLMNISIGDISHMSKSMFLDRLKGIQEKTTGKLIIKEYPTGNAHAGHIRALLNELKMKKHFTPDVLIVDYLNICSSSRIRSLGGSINSYTFVKYIAEEMRGLGVEFDIPVWSATQVNRAGYNNSDFDLEDTSESFGLPATADLMLGMICDEELESMEQILFKQLKNRYNNKSKPRRFVVGVDRERMALKDVEEDEQNVLDGPTADGAGANNTDDAPINRFDDFVME